MSVWIRTGTVSVTNGSASVTGSATLFVSDGVRLGFGFIGPDGRVYEVLSVTSNTALTLATPYEGSTVSGAAYQILPSAAVAREVSAQLINFQQSLQGYIDGALSGRFPDGTQAAPGIAFNDDVNTGIRRPASDTIAMVAGGIDQVITAAGIASGAAVQSSPTDITVGKLARADYAYSRGNVVGTVSQSGGVPTGAVIQRGSGPNGEFVRFADGTQICWHRAALTGGGFPTISYTWTFPAAFVNTFPVVSSHTSVASPAAGTRERQNWTGTGHVSRIFNVSMNVNFSTSFSEDHDLFAVGRWY